MPASKVQYEKVCPVCKNRFRAKTLYSLYCGAKCSRKAKVLKAREELLEQERQKRVAEMSLSDYISVSQASDIYQVSKDAIYRLIRRGILPSIPLGPRLIRISKSDIENLGFVKLPESVITKRQASEEHRIYAYRFDETDCFTVGEINRKYSLHDTTIWSAIRKKGIPICYRGNYAFVPKDLIDELFSDQKKRR